MFDLNRGLLASAVLVLAPFVANGMDELPTTRLLPVVTMSESGQPLSAEERSTPFLAHLGDISDIGFVEEEYEISGTGNIYDYVDDAAQSPEIAISESGLPYATRILVRRPANAAAFNGTVYVELLNSTATWDDDPFWRMSIPMLVREGAAYIGITSDPLTVNFLRDRWGAPEFVARNRSRYANLTMDRFGQAWDAYSQLGALLKADSNPENPMMGFGVQRLILTGYSQSANFVKTYGNSIHSRDIEMYGGPVYDGYFMGAGGFNSKFINPPPTGNDFHGTTDKRRFIDVDAPAIRFQTETELLAIFRVQSGRQLETGEPGGPKIRTYEMAGGTHVDINLETTGLYIRERDLGFSPAQNVCDLPVSPINVGMVQSAMMVAMDNWIRFGTEPPPSKLIELGKDENDQFYTVLDVNGNAVGGLRSPQIEVPVGQHLSNPFDIFNDCFLLGGFIPFTEERFRELYPSDQFYIQEVNRAVSSAVAQGFILAEDSEELRQTMLDIAAVENSGTGGDGVLGCTLGRNAHPDPTFPVLVVISLAWLTRRQWLPAKH